MARLNKTVIVIWTRPDDINPDKLELVDLAREATDGLAYCSASRTTLVADPSSDPDWDGTEFFDDGTDEEEAEA